MNTSAVPRILKRSVNFTPATELVLRHLSPRVEWTLVAIDERWRDKIKVIWRKRSSDPV